MNAAPSRRTVLRGAGIALGLPWLESLAPRAARAAPAPRRRTFVAFSFPLGTADFWKPSGTGAAWKLSPILEPLAPLKSHVTVLGNVGNHGPFGGHVEPSTANLTAAFLTCTKPVVTSGVVAVGPSVDQVIARSLAGRTRLPSLQVGLSTLDSFTDGLPMACARSISWASPTEPLFKLVDPQAVFDRLVADGPLPFAPTDPFAAARRASNKSVLDHVLGHAASVRAQLGRRDQTRLDDFLGSVRELEQRIETDTVHLACQELPRPKVSFGVGRTPPDYDRNAHADLMIDLVIMALACDLTRVVSFMLDDSRSDFAYNFLPQRTFTDTGSSPTQPPQRCGGYHGMSAGGNKNNGFATANRWMVEKLARFCGKLQELREDGLSLLDSGTVWFGSEMHGANNDGLDLPVLYVGSGGGRLVTDRYVDFAATARGPERLGNVYLTFLQKVFDLRETKFGDGTAVIPELLA